MGIFWPAHLRKIDHSGYGKLWVQLWKSIILGNLLSNSLRPTLSTAFVVKANFPQLHRHCYCDCCWIGWFATFCLFFRYWDNFAVHHHKNDIDVVFMVPLSVVSRGHRTMCSCKTPRYRSTSYNGILFDALEAGKQMWVSPLVSWLIKSEYDIIITMRLLDKLVI